MMTPSFVCSAKRGWLLVLSLLAAGALAGCGGPPEANAHLIAAREAYTAAASSPDLSTLAPTALAAAYEALEAAERAWWERQDTAEVEHQVYVARQRLRIAEERAALRSTEEAIRHARIERYRALLALEAARAEQAARAAAEREAPEPAEDEPPAAEPPPAEAAPSEPVGLGAVLTRRGLVLTLGDDAFADGGASLRPEATPTITALVDFLNAYPERRVQIEGFTDASGTRAEALDFSERRARAVEAALVEWGIASARIAAHGFGAAYPVASNEEPEGRRQNRRVEIVISGPRGDIPERE